ncbi:MAG: amidohydrolase family protein [Candidatus Nitrosocosmicus sp.]
MVAALTSIIKNADILYGSELQIIKNGIIIVNTQGIIERAGKSLDVEDTAYYSKIVNDKNTKIIDAKGYLIIPGLINSHTHIGDSIGKDISSNADLNTRVHPNHSIKKTVLEKTPPHQLKQLIRNAALSMLSKGITTFVDFREGGLNGIDILQTSLKDIPIKYIILGRIDFDYFYCNLDQKKTATTKINVFQNYTTNGNELFDKEILKSGNELLNSCNGFGISGANENDDKMLRIYKDIKKENCRQNTFNKKEEPIVAIHAAESVESVKESLKNTGKTEIERTVFTLEPDVFVHVTNPTSSDLNLLHSTRKCIVVCPRANGILGVGIVPLKQLVDRGFTISIGTDNIMLNSPDLFKEMDFLLKSQRAYEKNISFLDAKMVLKMATVNGGKIFNRNIGCIDSGFHADLLFIDEYDIDVYPMHDPYMSVVHRCSERTIKAIMIDGKFVHDKILLY